VGRSAVPSWIRVTLVSGRAFLGPRSIGLTTSQQKSLFGAEPEPARWERDEESDRLFAEVVFNRPIDEVFVYEVPYPLRDRLAVGKRVVAPFGRGDERMTGYCIGLSDRSGRTRLKTLLEVVDDDSLLTPLMLDLARWIARHYCCAQGQALDAVLPASVKAGVGMREVTRLSIDPGVRAQLPDLKLAPKQRRALEVLAESDEGMTASELARLAGCTLGPIRALERRNLVLATRHTVAPDELESLPPEPAEHLDLNHDQSQVLDRVISHLDSGGFHPMVLFGVTGSGKTEVYMRAIERVVARGGEAIVLVPEISLTPQTIRRFQSRFRDVAVLHSHLADAERHAQWRRIANGQSQVVVGARSAVFAPTRRLGLIVIDEEHEASFKQDTTPRYHARDVAWQRAQLEGVPLLLGSATPSLETWHRAQTGRCELLELPQRVLSRPLPDVKLIDLRHEISRDRRGAITVPLGIAMRQAVEQGGQVILLLNRRGFSTHIFCVKCGHVEKCRRCDIALVYHRDRSAAICHSCDWETPPPPRCSKCKDTTINFRGIGTERLEQEVRAKFPGVSCQRMDTDSMRGRGSHERVLSAFRSGDVRILLGTQMIAKGLDFPGVTLVGVINADTALHLPDFRAAERTFQLVAQVAGRTGRGERGGRVLVQTFSPEHPAIQAAAHHDFLSFAASELPQREQHGYPPFHQMTRIIVRSRQQRVAQETIDELAKNLASAARQWNASVRVLGPAPAPVTRVKSYFRFHLQMHGPPDSPLDQVLRAAITATRFPKLAEMAVDVDPLSML
jgi:primosomal protein N' (replication factor Y)